VPLSDDAFPLVEAAAANVPLWPPKNCGVDDGKNLTA